MEEDGVAGHAEFAAASRLQRRGAVLIGRSGHQGAHLVHPLRADAGLPQRRLELGTLPHRRRPAGRHHTLALHGARNFHGRHDSRGAEERSGDVCYGKKEAIGEIFSKVMSACATRRLYRPVSSL